MKQHPTRRQQYKYTYLSGPLGLFAIHIIKPDGTAEINYIHADHLGSWNTITDENGNLLQEQSFDAWGNRRDPDTWRAFTSTPEEPLFDRGFTGHEHLYAFNLINMNGRFYDPIIGRMLSPDNFMQAPDYTQSFNRYSYCWNNPLVLTDPDGEWVHLVVGAVIGGVFNWVANGAELSWEGLGYFGVGALAGALGAGVGAGISSMLPVAGTASGGFVAGFLGTSAATTATSSFISGALIGGGAGFASGFTSGLGNGLLDGQKFGQALWSGTKSGLIGGFSGAAIGGLWGGIDAARNDRHFITGKNPFYEANLDNYINIPQNNPINCKNATLEAIDRMNGGSRTQEYFKKEGLKFLADNPNATLDQYFVHFGFKIEDPVGRSYRFVGSLMKTGNPTVIDQNIGGGHTLTIVKIRQWTPTSNVKVWFADPQSRIWKANWNIIGRPGFNRGAYTFILK